MSSEHTIRVHALPVTNGSDAQEMHSVMHQDGLCSIGQEWSCCYVMYIMLWCNDDAISWQGVVVLFCDVRYVI